MPPKKISYNQLIERRSTLNEQLESFENYLESASNARDECFYETLALKFKRIDKLNDDFYNVQTEIELITEQFTIEAKVRLNFEERLDIASGKAKSLLACNRSSNTAYTSREIRSQNIKLPTIDIPTFNGDITKWSSFDDAFNALIINNESISDVLKFYYLKGALSGEALTVVESLETTATNFIIAYDLLKKRFSHRRRTIYAHANHIFNLKNMNLKSVANSLDQYLRSLATFGIDVNNFNAFLVPFIISKQESRFIRDWESYVNNSFENDELPTCQHLINYLLEKSYTLESSKVYQSVLQKPKFQLKSLSTTNKDVCQLCNEHHPLFKCKEFLKKSTNDRFKFAKESNICINCLQKGHNSNNCNSSKCKKCQKPHNTLLHFEKKQANNNESANDINDETTVSNCSLSHNKSLSLLCTAVINVNDKYNRKHTARALLDSGSQSNFITESFASKLGCKKHAVNKSVSGINQSLSHITHCATIKLSSRVSTYSTEISCLVLKQITDNLPQFSFEHSMLQIADHIKLADENFNESNEVDLLLGSDVFWQIMLEGHIKTNGLVFQNTQFGWIASGSIPLSKSFKTVSYMAINDEIKHLWDIDDSYGNEKHLSTDEKICEEIFENTTTRDKSGRFIVTLPLKESEEKLGDSKTIALRRFFALENRLEKEPHVKQKYIDFMREYINLNHMVEDNDNPNSIEYFLPHHPVVREESITTKLRVVFDASTKTTSNFSLNDIQYNGPVVQSDLFTILINFRKYKFIATADIEKMYRQIIVKPEQQNLQKIFWRESRNEKLRTYKLLTVTYGTKSAPYLATRCLKEVASIHKASHIIPSQIIQNDMYVDDVLTGSNSEEELIDNCTQVSQLLANAGFSLRKWASNSDKFRKSFKSENAEQLLNLYTTSNETKTLGIRLNTNTDEFKFSFKLKTCEDWTKRSVLSLAAQTFDPLGILTPITIVPKLIIQQLWKEKIDWDENIPKNVESIWLRYINQISNSFNITQKRQILISNYDYVELHGFADASEKAYGACLYLKSVDNKNNKTISLITSKSRVAPLKTITLPRLELCAAVLLAKLFKRIKTTLNIEINKEYLWSDSTITLSWIQGEPSKWKAFVSHRVAEIQNLTQINNWHHVKSADNPADLISRGVLPDSLIATKLWWEGPAWLGNKIYPIIATEQVTEVPDSKPLTIKCKASTLTFNIFDKYSTLPKLVRIFAYCIRFINKCKGIKVTMNHISSHEYANSLKTLIKIAQGECFGEEVNALKANHSIKTNSNLLSLSPFLDKDGILRVGGRLQNSELNYNQRHQIILPKHTLSNLIASFTHKINLHCGPQQLLYTIRQNYWPVAGRKLTKDIVHKCINCFKQNPKSSHQLMGQLPKERITQAPPFFNTGIDFAGPFKGRDKRSRGYKTFKIYACLFICMSTKAVHLEAVGDLSTPAFILALRRFAARRGKPDTLFSDNGTNFIGANAELNRIIKALYGNSENVIKDLQNEGTNINWKFIPPRSPHFGGIWEAHIKSVKRHLIRVSGDMIYTFEEFVTLLTQIEGVINSRPLCPLSSNPSDLNPLTPAHFLIGRTIMNVSEEDYSNTKLNRLAVYERIQKIKQDFWKRWRNEYLTELQQKSKWKTLTNPIEIDDLVILIEDNTPPATWKMARVEKLWPGKDGVTRVVSVKTPTGIYKRAINKICKLPIDDDNN